jgi:Ca-activated chloride channel family protein
MPTSLRSVNRFLIEGLARAGLGEPFVVTEPAEAADAAVRLRRYIDSPVLTGIDVTFVGLDTYDVEPRKVPDLFASRPIVAFGKWRGQAGGSVEISGTTGRGHYHTSIPIGPWNADASHRALRQLWARTRIAELSDFGPSTPDADRVAAITSLGLTYSLLTRYTSFVAVQELVRTAGGGGDEVDEPLPPPEGVSDRAVGVTQGSEPELIWIVAIALALLGCVSLMRSRTRRQGVAA